LSGDQHFFCGTDAALDFATACHYVLAMEPRFEITDMEYEMTRTPVLAAGGIVLRQEETPLVAVVRLRKRNEWVLPKGKLDDGETPRDAAEREVMEETGHDVAVHDFLGTLVYESGGRSKVVHYWRMEANGEQVYDLMDDVRAVDWLPLEAAVERLSRGHEQAFLANVGPLALEAAAPAKAARRSRPKPAVAEKRGGRRTVANLPSLAAPVSIPPQPDLRPLAFGRDQGPGAVSEFVAAEASAAPAGYGWTPQGVEAVASVAQPGAGSNDTARTDRGGRRNLMQKMRDWLRRAAA
jgi:8-oxo-dGTP diphosphatase